jgi:hypothetical protein
MSNDDFLKLCADKLSVPTVALTKQGTRAKFHMAVRKSLIYLLCDHMSLNMVAKLLGYENHTSILHINRVMTEVDNDNDLDEYTADILFCVSFKLADLISEFVMQKKSERILNSKL